MRYAEVGRRHDAVKGLEPQGMHRTLPLQRFQSLFEQVSLKRP